MFWLSTMLFAADQEAAIFSMLHPIWHYCVSQFYSKPEPDQESKPKTQMRSEMQAGKRLETLLKQIVPNDSKSK